MSLGDLIFGVGLSLLGTVITLVLAFVSLGRSGRPEGGGVVGINVLTLFHIVFRNGMYWMLAFGLLLAGVAMHSLRRQLGG